MAPISSLEPGRLQTSEMNQMIQGRYEDMVILLQVLLVYLIGRPQARSVSRSANAQNGCESNSGPSDTSTMGPDRKPEDSDSEGPSDEILRRCEEVRALKARAKQRREDRERIHGPPIPPSPPRQFTPEEWKIIRKRQPKRRAAMQLLLIAARAAFDSFDNPNGTHIISIYALTTTIRTPQVLTISYRMPHQMTIGHDRAPPVVSLTVLEYNKTHDCITF